MRRTFTVVDIVEIMIHWYAGRSQAQICRSLGVDRKTMRKYTKAAIDAGLVPGGPAITEEEWRAKVRTWFPVLYDTRLSRPSWPEIARHHETIKTLVGVVPVSVIHQRLTDEFGLEASAAQPAPLREGALRRGGAPGRRGSLAPGRRARRGGPGQLRLHGHLERPQHRNGPAGVGLSHGAELLPAPLRLSDPAHGPGLLVRRPFGRLRVLWWGAGRAHRVGQFEDGGGPPRPL